MSSRIADRERDRADEMPSELDVALRNTHLRFLDAEDEQEDRKMKHIVRHTTNYLLSALTKRSDWFVTYDGGQRRWTTYEFIYLPMWAGTADELSCAIMARLHKKLGDSFEFECKLEPGGESEEPTFLSSRVRVFYWQQPVYDDE